MSGSPAWPPAAAQTPGINCRGASGTPEVWGPTDIGAVTGNGKLSVGLNRRATVTVFKWPSPSYYDQIKYRTRDRAAPLMGALPNEGAFLGIGWSPKPKSKTRKWSYGWLRDWKVKQRFGGAANDEVITTFNDPALGLTVRVRDVVAAGRAALVRRIVVTKKARSPVQRVRIVAFSNFNPAVSKIRQNPIADWCTEEQNDAGANYIADDDAVAHVRNGTDESTGQARNVALMMGFASRSHGYHVGPDTYQQARAGTSAFDHFQQDGNLKGETSASGQADAVMVQERRFGRSSRAASTVIMTAGPTLEAATRALNDTRARSYKSVRGAKAQWWKKWLRGARIPDGAPPAVARLAKRALLSLRQATDPSSGLIVSSIATQAPLGADWPSRGAYINRALLEARHPEMSARHNRAYASLQATITRQPPGGEATPYGNWSQNFYGDGVVAGPSPYEIDSTGLAIWTLWDHFRATKNRVYLYDVYGSMRRAAHYLTDDAPVGCRDPASGLQCSAHTDGSTTPVRNLKGAVTAWLGLDAAVKAAKAYGPTESENAKRWAARRADLGRAIRRTYLDEDCSCFTTDPQAGATLLWPARFGKKRSGPSLGQAKENWRSMRRALRGKVAVGGMEARIALGNAHVWGKSPAERRALRKALAWIASDTTTRGTSLLGGAWMNFPKPSSRITPMVSQPHVWGQAMFYLASLEVYGRKAWRP